MAELVDVAVDDAYDLWVCPVHGIISEDELVEGQSASSAHPGDPDGWTGRFYCQRCRNADPPVDDVQEALLVNIRVDVEFLLAAVNRSTGEPTSQQVAALLKANYVKTQNKRWRANTKRLPRHEGVKRVQGLLQSPTFPRSSMSVLQALLSIKRIGNSKAMAMIVGAGIRTGTRRIDDLSSRQRELLVYGLGALPDFTRKRRRSKAGSTSA